MNIKIGLRLKLCGSKFKKIIHTIRFVPNEAPLDENQQGDQKTNRIHSYLKTGDMAKNIEEKKYEIILNNSPDFVFESRIDNFKFTKVNQRACDFYGYTNEEFLQYEHL